MSVSIKKVVLNGKDYNRLAYRSFTSFVEDSIFNNLKLEYNENFDIIAKNGSEVLGEYNKTTKKGFIFFSVEEFGNPYI